MGFEVYFKFILTLALVLIAARIGGELAERYFKQPSVLGEVLAGVIISPFALGGLIFRGDPIILNFATIKGAFGLSEFHAMEVISQIAVIILLFVAGVKTDVRLFLKHGITGAMVAIGGVILPFCFGYLATMMLCPEIKVQGWLFMGAVLTATSIALTVRILMDVKKLHTAEGAIILVAAVIDDILGILCFSIVASVAKTGKLDISHATQIIVLGFAVWFALLLIGVKFNKYISKYLLNPFKDSGTMPIFALIIGLLIAYLVTLVDLHPVVGAYVAGLMFAATKEKEEIIEKTMPIMMFLSPFFFCYLGMQVNVWLMVGAPVIATILIVLAIIGKIIGCFIPAKFVGKLTTNRAMIVGVGMVPRAEVGLIIAGAGFLSGAINRELFGAVVAVCLVTTLITPLMIKPLLAKENLY